MRHLLHSGMLSLCVRLAFAEGSSDTGAAIRLDSNTLLHVDVLDVSELITWTGFVENAAGDDISVSIDLLDPLDVLLGSWPSGSTIPALVGTGTYTIVAQPPDTDADADGDPDPLSSWSISVDGTAPGQGRVWATRWWFAPETLFAPDALSESLYVLADGGFPGRDAVTELRFDGWAGRVFQLAANSVGAASTHARSVAVGAAVFVAEHPIYLRPPEMAFIDPVTPTLVDAHFDAGFPIDCDAAVVGTGGTFVLDGDVSGTAHVVCDVSRDGNVDPTDPDDFHLLEEGSVGTVELDWDGSREDGVPVLAGHLTCDLFLTVGEVHVAAQDVETSYEGLRMFEIAGDGSVYGLPMYWDDTVPAVTDVDMPDLSLPRVRTGTGGLPSGDPGVDADADVNARSWGAFVVGSRGDESLLNTWAYQRVARSTLTLALYDAGQDSDGDGLPDVSESCVVGTSLASGDSDGDGVADGVEAGDALGPVDSDGDGLVDGMDADDDGDGTPTADEFGDTDGDGIDDRLDDDDDGDNIVSAEEVGDTDGDLVPDRLDQDDDGDGIDTVDESGDHDEDGVPDSLDDDDDGDGVPTADEEGDTDLDEIGDWLDPDDDGDGIPTLIEGDADEDGDGVPAWLDPDDDDDGVVSVDEGSIDTDGDGLINAVDPDDDGDGIFTVDEDVDGDGAPGNDDTDLDAVANYLDDDDDNDGVKTLTEGLSDWDGDGLPAHLDADDDNDGTLTLLEDRNGNGDPTDDDNDNDATPDFLDEDDDNDGVSSWIEGTEDSDGDGLADAIDVDSDDDSALDSDEGVGDSDSDGLDDRIDVDDDDDGVPSIEEWGLDSDADGVDDALDPDDDEDGVPTAVEGRADTDEDGVENYRDPDSDDDGVPDSVEQDVDTDADGTPDRLDLDSDADTAADELEGASDSDSDGVGDWRDVDDDGDGIPTAAELVADTDQDGLDNRVDPDDDDDGLVSFVELTDTLGIPTDMDNDFLDAWVDVDADGDGVDDAEEGRADVDDDRRPDYLDPDGRWATWYGGGACDTADASVVGSMAGFLAAVVAFLRYRSRDTASKKRMIASVPEKSFVLSA